METEGHKSMVPEPGWFNGNCQAQSQKGTGGRDPTGKVCFI